MELELEIDEGFQEKFKNVTPEIINEYVTKYKDLTLENLLLLDDITMKKSKGKNNLEMLLTKLFEASLDIEYYEASANIKTILLLFQTYKETL